MAAIIRLKKMKCPIYNKVEVIMNMSNRKRGLSHLLHRLSDSNTDKMPQTNIGVEVIIVLSIGLQR